LAAVPRRSFVNKLLLVWGATRVTPAEPVMWSIRFLPIVMLLLIVPASEMGGQDRTLDIPRVGLSAVIAEGDGEATLRVAVGHLPDTALPWHDGNTALADTFFRPLQHILVGDEVRVSTRYGDFRYQVRETRVVSPDELWVLGPTDRPTLTLITCFPFTSIGKAPRRFIVKAERTGAARPTR